MESQMRGWLELGAHKVDVCFVQLSGREEERWDGDGGGMM